MEKWLAKNKLQFSDQLGDSIMQFDVGMELFDLLASRVSNQSDPVRCSKRRVRLIVPYSTSAGFKMYYSSMLNQFLFSNPRGALDLAKNAEGDSLIDIEAQRRPI